MIHAVIKITAPGQVRGACTQMPRSTETTPAASLLHRTQSIPGAIIDWHDNRALIMRLTHLEGDLDDLHLHGRELVGIELGPPHLLMLSLVLGDKLRHVYLDVLTRRHRHQSTLLVRVLEHKRPYQPQRVWFISQNADRSSSSHSIQQAPYDCKGIDILPALGNLALMAS